METENPKAESIANIIEITCQECDQMHTEFCHCQCIYQVLFTRIRSREKWVLGDETTTPQVRLLYL